MFTSHLICFLAGAVAVIIYQAVTPGNEEKQVKALITRMKKATLSEKEKLKKRAKSLIDKV